MNLVQLSGCLARDPRFHDWLGQHSVPPCSIDTLAAAQWIRITCRVTSRRELADNPEAQQLFHSCIRRPFRAWCEEQERMAHA